MTWEKTDDATEEKTDGATQERLLFFFAHSRRSRRLVICRSDQKMANFNRAGPGGVLSSADRDGFCFSRTGFQLPNFGGASL